MRPILVLAVGLMLSACGGQEGSAEAIASDAPVAVDQMAGAEAVDVAVDAEGNEWLLWADGDRHLLVALGADGREITLDLGSVAPSTPKPRLVAADGSGVVLATVECAEASAAECTSATLGVATYGLVDGQIEGRRWTTAAPVDGPGAVQLVGSAEGSPAFRSGDVILTETRSIDVAEAGLSAVCVTDGAIVGGRWSDDAPAGAVPEEAEVTITLERLEDEGWVAIPDSATTFTWSLDEMIDLRCGSSGPELGLEGQQAVRAWSGSEWVSEVEPAPSSSG